MTHHELHDKDRGYLVAANYDEIEANMLYGGMTLAGLYGSIRNPLPFTTYMSEFEQRNPDAIVFTMYSAIPVADSVRGYYEEKGLQLPVLARVRANTALSSPKTTEMNGGYVQTTIDFETRRLASELSGARVCVFDQFVSSGGTLHLAKHILQLAGATVLGSTDEAQWYEHTYRQDIKRKDITSIHAGFMRSVGRRAAQSVA